MPVKLVWKNELKTEELEETKAPSPYFFNYRVAWTSYDNDEDILYLHFKKPGLTNTVKMKEDEVVIHYKNNEIIGVTIIDAKQKLKK